jgi:integrase
MKVRAWEEQRLGVKPERSWQEAAVRWLKETGHKRSHGKDVAKLRWLDRYLGHLMLHQVTRDLIDKIGEAKAKATSPANANRYLALVRSILRRARDDWEWLDHIPKVRLYRESTRRVRWITREEAAMLLDELPLHLREMAQFALSTGLRQRNVSYLTWDQVDMARQVAWIHPDQAKAGRAIAVPLNQDALAVLRRQLGRHAQYVFTYQGKPVERCSTKAWKLACERAGIRDFRWHDLRHTWASWHVQSGTSLQELMELGSWATHEMVMRYAHLAADHLKTAASRIDGTFSSQSAKVHHLRAA